MRCNVSGMRSDPCGIQASVACKRAIYVALGRSLCTRVALEHSMASHLVELVAHERDVAGGGHAASWVDERARHVG